MSGVPEHTFTHSRGLEGLHISQTNVIIGLYGVPGSGKSDLLNNLKLELGRAGGFRFFEGSEVIASLVAGGLDTFEKMEEVERLHWRAQAIKKIKEQCLESGETPVVTGHFMIWTEGEDDGIRTHTPTDFNIFTHILYLNVAPEDLLRRYLTETDRGQPSVSVEHLSRWQSTEITELRQLCRRHGIYYSVLAPDKSMVKKVADFLKDFRYHTPAYNLLQARKALEEAIALTRKSFRGAWVIDADRTLTAEDSGALFWSLADGPESDSALQALFSSSWAYSYQSFRQATLLYEEINEQTYDCLCQNVASSIKMHPEFLCLLRLAADAHVFLAVVTSGPRLVWDKVMEREGLAGVVTVLGGGRLVDGYVLTPEVKGSLCSQLRGVYHMLVVAFAGSPIEIPMLKRANRAIVVAGVEGQRSRSMDGALAEAIVDGLQACQTLLPRGASPRLSTTQLPLVDLTDANFLESLIPGGLQPVHNKVTHTTNRAASKLLMTQMRDKSISSVHLREAHRATGRYLATELLGDPDVVGLEEHPIQHVQGHQITGYRLFHEKDTLIVAIMRAGEPMAYGVSDTFPLSMFLHANHPNDIEPVHVHEKTTVLLVDSVVNTGQTILQFVQHIRKIHATIQIVVVAGVIQSRCVTGGDVALSLSQYKRLHICALRLSDNQFTGKGATDTGNRLFNTTQL
ncbi:uncharacterized protein LDX57_007816 [Aspergillus melleus]|uniref:uncharacterized protein n=1 Tax=Aspergillus melleus TaxID=138277 RepID=UPI001E8CB808|nr:uncharacterized protein LDX57_007816 [Aspergillus melleus]KAH8430146.1 hypothetical protein LDX57_007816 [Aspergillus melleus]